MTYLELGYIGLFLIAFLSATILPLSSEGALIAFLAMGYFPLTVLMVASAGNILGSLTNYGIGYWGKTHILTKYGHSKKTQQFERLAKKYGYWLGLIVWLPIIGDPLTIAIGYFRVQFIPFLILMSAGKLGRYALIIYFWN